MPSGNASSFSRSLNGPWKFNWVPRPEQRPVDSTSPITTSCLEGDPRPSTGRSLDTARRTTGTYGLTFQKAGRVMTEPPKD